MDLRHGSWRLLVGVFVVLTDMKSVMSTAEGVLEPLGPLGCYTCSSTTHGIDCYDPVNQTSFFNSAAIKNCTYDQNFCTVKRTWYVLEGQKEDIEFSINRTCASACAPYCMVIGDRTKIYSCLSCCTETLCNNGSSTSCRPQSWPVLTMLPPLLLAALTLTHALLPPCHYHGRYTLHV